MSYPNRFDASQANNKGQTQNNEYQGPFYVQSYGSTAAPTNPIPPVCPVTNTFFPPVNFSVPPPNFNNAQMNIYTTQLPPPPQPSSVHQYNQQQQIYRQRHSYQNSRDHSAPVRSSKFDERRDTKKCHDLQSSRKPDDSTRSFERNRNRDRDSNRNRDRDGERNKDRDRYRNQDRRRDRDRETDRNRDKVVVDKRRIRDRKSDNVNDPPRRDDHKRNRDRDRDAKDRVKDKSRDRSYQNCDNRGRKYSTHPDRSRSDSTFSKTSTSSKSDTRNIDDRTNSVQLKPSSSCSSRTLSTKRETSQARSDGCETKNSPEKSLSVKEPTERARILQKWRSNFCKTSEDITRKLEELNEDAEKETYIRSSPAELFYRRTPNNEIEGKTRSEHLCNLFRFELVERGKRARQSKPVIVDKPRKRRHRVCRHKGDDKCSSSDSSDNDLHIEDDSPMEELTKKTKHPYRLHKDLWHNEPGEMNDGPLCRCSAKSRRTGIRHNIYPGEEIIPKCLPNSNNATKLYHYKITVSPPTNFLTKTPTMIKHDEHEFLFEGFSLLSHQPLGEFPDCTVIRFNIEYKIMYFEEKMPENFTIQELDLFTEYLFGEILEMTDFSVLPKQNDDTCSLFHFFPRFVRAIPDNGKEILSMSVVLKYLLDNSGPLVDGSILKDMDKVHQREWQEYVDEVKGMVVTNPGMKPCSIRVDQLDRNVGDLPNCVDPEDANIVHPVIVHFAVRPPQLSYAGNSEYQKSWREYVKFRHLVANMSKPSYEDKRKLEAKESRLQEMRTEGRFKRNIPVDISSKGFYRTGIMCDIVQHALLIPVLTTHLRFHQSLNLLENNIQYKFKNRYLLQLALTHPSYKENFGTNPDHARNSLSNCGIRQPEYGDRKIHYLHARKRGINTLINIMSLFGKENATESSITHNERLEFLGDAVVEFITSVHLFLMFPDLEEGGLATYRAAIVQNQHLAVLAKKLRLDEFMLYAHGSDLCHELELRHAMANCFEAFMGALHLDGGIEVADKVFGTTLFLENDTLKRVWVNLPQHPLQEQEPLGDRQWIKDYPLLQSLVKFEDTIGAKFHHIRLLARAFTDRSIGYTHLTMGSNQRLEFLGDTVLQLICSEFLYRHFPEHHEGHLSLLRSSLVNNRTQAVVCDDLGMTEYAIYANPKTELKTKDRADLLEAFLGALYVDKGLAYPEVFCQVCLFPRLQMFIMNQDWNDSKSKLQQCCLTLRTMDGGEPDIPVYKVIECTGPTNTRVYKVAVYFRGKRLASSSGHSIQQAEMEAAKTALENSSALFPQLDYQKRVIANSMKRQKGKPYTREQKRNRTELQKIAKKIAEDDSHLPKQYRINEKSNKQSSDESNSLKSDSDGKYSDSSHLSCSTNKTKRTKQKKKHKHRKKNRANDEDEPHLKCKDENKQELQSMQEKLETQINETNANTIQDFTKHNDVEDDLAIENYHSDESDTFKSDSDAKYSDSSHFSCSSRSERIKHKKKLTYRMKDHARDDSDESHLTCKNENNQELQNMQERLDVQMYESNANTTEHLTKQNEVEYDLEIETIDSGDDIASLESGEIS